MLDEGDVLGVSHETPVAIEKSLEPAALGREIYVTSEHEHFQIRASTDPNANINMDHIQYWSNPGRHQSEDVRPAGDESVKIAMIEQLVATRNQQGVASPL